MRWVEAMLPILWIESSLKREILICVSVSMPIKRWSRRISFLMRFLKRFLRVVFWRITRNTEEGRVVFCMV